MLKKMNYNINDTLISTRTIISDVNIELDIEKIFKSIPFHDKIDGYSCYVVAMYHKNVSKGDMSVFQNKKNNASFRNAVNIIIKVEDKLINIKVSKHGNFQITGCKNKNHSYISICYFIELCLKHCADAIKKQSDNINIYFYTVMTNIVFNVGFNIDKKKLNNLILKQTNFYNLFETSFGYTGMNIKLPLEQNWNNFEIPYYSYQNNQWLKSFINFKNREKEKKQKFNTFLVFHSGKIIMSGMCEENMEQHYNFFYNFIQSNRSVIEETLV
jgi:TATA-box binding protein (TBP) (component of TFIID and TFIIIB)